VVGVEIPEAVINDKSYEHQFTNEGGVQNTIRFLVNITGLWIVQECRRHWQKEGDDLSYAELTEMAAAAKPFAAYIDPGKDAFLAPGEMPRRINEYLEANGQEAIDDKGQMVRVVLEGLALKYRDTIDKIEDSSGSTVEVLHIVGGGTQNELLSQFAANAIGKRVVTGPVEATAIGNVMMQAIAAGQIGSLSDGRAMVRNSCVVKEFQPKEADAWNERYEGTRK
jgi:rhamnulokinase